MHKDSMLLTGITQTLQIKEIVILRKKHALRLFPPVMTWQGMFGKNILGLRGMVDSFRHKKLK